MAKPGPSGVARLLQAFGYAFRGIALGLRHELAFRVEIATAALAVPVALLVGGNGLERALLVAVVLVVPLVGLLNSAIEVAVDRVGPEHHRSPAAPRTWQRPRCCYRWCWPPASGRSSCWGNVMRDRSAADLAPEAVA